MNLVCTLRFDLLQNLIKIENLCGKALISTDDLILSKKLALNDQLTTRLQCEASWKPQLPLLHHESWDQVSCSVSQVRLELREKNLQLSATSFPDVIASLKLIRTCYFSDQDGKGHHRRFLSHVQSRGVQRRAFQPVLQFTDVRSHLQRTVDHNPCASQRYTLIAI